MMVGILQSSYLPWLGVFDMLDRVDLFVLHDDLQYDKSWRNRNRIRTGGEQGWTWLTVPVSLPVGTATQLDQARVDHAQPWARKHWALIAHNYQRAPWFERYAPAYEAILLGARHELLTELNEALLAVAMEQLGLVCPIRHSRELGLGNLRKNARVAAICRAVGADVWLANSACRDYVEPEIYEKSGVRVVFQDYAHPEYPQQYTPFVSHLSILDLIFNCGPDSLDVIRSTRGTQ